MENKITELVFILDKSGSMSGLEEDTIGGFNSLIEKQKEVDGIALVTTVLFNHKYEVIHNRVDLEEITPLTTKEYYVGGTTSLLDAVGRTITTLKEKILDIPKRLRPSKVMFVIITDGFENSSKIYNTKEIKELIDLQKKEYDWQFMFLGANIDAVVEAEKIGINRQYAANFEHTKEGVMASYEIMDKAVQCFRETGEIDEDWKKYLEK